MGLEIGVGDRWANKKFNYSVIYSKKTPTLYSENDDKIPSELLGHFLKNEKGVGIIGIFVHSRRMNKNQKRPIRKDIKDYYKVLTCVVCGTHATICDHKNDLYNDERVLSTTTQLLSDFQPLCNHCNLQKRQVCITERENQRLYSAKNIERYKIYLFDYFPWEKKVFDTKDIHCKNGTYWFDPVEFDKNIYYYTSYTIPIINEIKHKIKTNIIAVLQ
jgi:5-methylcytosine-specific restriction endonuclease McrA